MTPAKKGPKKPRPDVEVSVERPRESTTMERVAIRTAHPIYRLVETAAFILAIVFLFALMTVEVLHRAGARLGTGEPDHGFPWGIAFGVTVLVAPKLIGRAFAGRALVAMAGRGDFGTTGEREAGGA